MNIRNRCLGKYIQNVLRESTPGLVLFGEMLCLYFYLSLKTTTIKIWRGKGVGGGCGELVKARVIRESFKAGEEGLNWALKNDEELDGLWAGKRKSILHEGTSQSSEVGNEHYLFLD